MYNYGNFKEDMGASHMNEYLIRTILLCQKKFKAKSIIEREDLLGLGDSWANMACIDRLVELDFLYVIKVSDIATNYTTYGMRGL